MAHRIRCYTLFDITQTNVTARRAPLNFTAEELSAWEKRRNSQCNYDTLLQIISLRGQPEDNTTPVKSAINFTEFQNFGFLFDGEEDQECWSFEFVVNHHGVFDDGITELGALFSDCDGVPMIKIGTEWNKLPNFLDSSPELKNIHFEVLT